MNDERYKRHKHKSMFQDLANILEKDTVVRLLLPAVRARFGADAAISRVQVKHLAKRVFTCTLRITTTHHEADSSWTVAAKTFPGTERRQEERLVRAFELMEELWEKGFARDADDGISVCEPLCIAHDIPFLFMEFVPGEKLRRLIKSTEHNTEYMCQCARTLAKLQRCPIRLEETRTVQSELQKRERAYVRLMDAFPDLKASITFIQERASRLETSFGMDMYTPVHGDYNLGQLHIAGERCWLLDFDDIRLGDPAWDVANVLTLSLLNDEKPGVSNGQKLRDAFQEAYYATMDASIAQRVPLYEAFYRLSRAVKHYWTQEPGRLATVPNLIAQAVACLERVQC